MPYVGAMAHPPVPVPRERLSRWLDNFAASHGAPSFSLDADEAGVDELVVQAPDGAVARFVVPYGPVVTTGDPRADVLAHLAHDRTVGVLLVRRGGHAVGVFVGDRLAASKVGTSYVQGRTKAGGWSQQRYARRRSNQADRVVERTADDAVRVLVDAAPGPLEGLVCGGDQALCEQVLADPRLAEVRARWQPQTVHPVPDPRLRVLQGFVDRVTGVQVVLNDRARQR